MDKQTKIVITGGPGGGKTTALDLFRRELISKVAIVPEAATILFSSGIDRCGNNEVLSCIQKSIYNLQNSVEDIVSKQHPNKLLLCDRGALDGLAYWPGSEEDFFLNINSNLEQEINRYSAVIFFETAAKTGKPISSNNPIRNESNDEAIALDNKLQAIWSKHPNYNFIPSSESFIKKIMFGIMTIDKLINLHQR